MEIEWLLGTGRGFLLHMIVLIAMFEVVRVQPKMHVDIVILVIFYIFISERTTQCFRREQRALVRFG